MTGLKEATAILDIGKTNVKLVLLDAEGAVIGEARRANTIATDGPYPHHDTEGIRGWLLATLRGFASQARITAIVPVTHGATAALVDDKGLVLPVPDYEYALPGGGAHYDAVRPDFAATLSPALPAGLNLGRQLHWLATAYPAQFAQARHILMYPQYWAWLLSGVAASEVTSLGCHTDLWQPGHRQYSALVEKMGWKGQFPAMRNAWDILGTIKPALARQTGVSEECVIVCGIHDSNASLLRHLPAAGGVESGPRAVLSTGTWVIAAALGRPLDGLKEAADMLANVNALGDPVACMRFMGGREFGELAGDAPAACTADDIARVIDQGTLAIPAFAAGGPFAAHTGRIDGPLPQSPTERYALASLYCALMSDYCLDMLGADTGPVIVEGSYTGNPHFAPLLAALRMGQQVQVSSDTSGTTSGGWMLRHWGSKPGGANTVAPPIDLPDLHAYRGRWRAALPR
ncbi:L-fuculose kinase [Duganella sp. FT92W]|uniref:L-fuculose kinase n=1 Tax=Pseudoduganella rivuli TaxID=2666085 RepID=A0A7X2IU83_9BURK|nr:FGGY family carbohydrate kinase [Pseudoduganella rivuli]MRV76206.1 L-fuculose kinase [Pseudoduganella rivuli]